MSIQNFISSRTFLRHLIAAIALITILIVVTLQGLKIYTRHGQANPVPDFSGLSGNEIKETAEQHQLKFEIIDSIHVNDALPGAVVEQFPEPGFKVKEKRTIFLTVNSTNPEKISVPKLTDISFRQALVLIENSGLTIGEIRYLPSEYNDLVLKIEKDSTELFTGELILKGSSIDLFVGRSLGNQETILPNLIGLTLAEANELLISSMLNQGVLLYDQTVQSTEDTLSAFVWRQFPTTNNTQTIKLGASVDIWLTLDSLRIQSPTIPEIE